MKNIRRKGYSYYYHLGIIRQCRTRELVTAVEDVGVAGIEAEHELPLAVEDHDAAFLYEDAGAAGKVLPVDGFALAK